MGFMAIMLVFIMDQFALELEAAFGPVPRSEPLSLPLLLRLRESLTCAANQLPDCMITEEEDTKKQNSNSSTHM